MITLTLEGVKKYFAGIRAVDNVSFDVEEGSITALIGPNGAGKTTIINLISGIYPVTEGDIRFSQGSLIGMSVAEVAHAGIRRTFQTVHLFPGLTVIENVVLARYRDAIAQSCWRALLPFALGDADGLRKSRRILEMLNLGDVTDKIATTLPYGTQRKVEIARALAGSPKLLLLDEPVAGMNEVETEDIRDQIKNIRDSGVTVLLIEHNMYLVMNVSDKVIVVDFGRKIAEGTPEDIQADQAVIRSYLGE